MVCFQQEKDFLCKIDKLEKSELYARKIIDNNDKIHKEWVKAVERKSNLQTISLGKYYDKFIENRLKIGRFKNANEVICAGLRLLETDEIKIAALKAEIENGIDSAAK